MSPVKTAQAVDSHAHVFSADSPAVAGARYRPAYSAEPARWRSQWPGAGITHGVVVQPSFFGADNREMLVTVAADPKRLRGVAVLPPLVDEATLERFHAQGVRAIRLNLRGAEDFAPYSGASWRGMLERVHAFGWHVEVFVDAGRLPEISAALEATPVTTVFDHFGSPGRDPGAIDATFAAVERLARTREVWCKLSAPYRLKGGDARELAARWREAVGSERLLWGSDWPWTGHEANKDYARLRAALDDWVDADLARKMLWDNPARLYQFT